MFPSVTLLICSDVCCDPCSFRLPELHYPLDIMDVKAGISLLDAGIGHVLSPVVEHEPPVETVTNGQVAGEVEPATRIACAEFVTCQIGCAYTGAPSHLFSLFPEDDDGTKR